MKTVNEMTILDHSDFEKMTNEKRENECKAVGLIAEATLVEMPKRDNRFCYNDAGHCEDDHCRCEN